MDTYIFPLNSFIDINVTLSALQDFINADVSSVIKIISSIKNEENIILKYSSAVSIEQETALNNIILTYKELQKKVSKAHSSIVSSNGDCDYTSIAAAFIAGEQSVFIKNGIYYETQNIIIPDFGQLTGESTGGVYIVLLNGSSIMSDGSNGIIENIGTISLTYNTKIITGINTTFTNLAADEFIQIGTNFYKISSIESNTSLTLSETYTGASIFDANYKASKMNSGVIIKNLVITMSTSYGIYLRSVRHSIIESIVISKCMENLYITNCSDISLIQIISYLGKLTGCYIGNSISISLNTINTFNNNSHGVIIDNNTNTCFTSCASENNKLNGYNIIGCKYEKLLNCISKFNNNSGIYSDITSSAIAINNCDISYNNINAVEMHGSTCIVSTSTLTYNNGIGISVNVDTIVSNNQITENIGDAIYIGPTGSKCVISNNCITDITGMGVNIGGTNNIISSNSIHNISGDVIYCNMAGNSIINNTILDSESNGINISGIANTIITNNIISNMIGDGILLSVGTTDSIVTGNIIKNNGGTNLNDNGTGTLLANNIT